MKDISNIFNLSPNELQEKRKPENLWSDTAPDIVNFATKLENFLTLVDTPYVVGLEGGYGTGKTHFATRFSVQMDSKIKTLYFSAWEKDYIKEPLHVFIEMIIWLVKNEQEVIKSISQPLIAKLVLALYKTTSLDLALPLGKLPITANINIKKFMKKINSIDLSMDILQEAKDSLREFIKCLPHNKLIFIVDDLDRCRPDIAVKTLEVVKHFFDIEGLIVIIPVSKHRLSVYIKAFYGISTEDQKLLGAKEDYLQKFFNEFIEIPALDYEKICKDKITAKEFINNLVYEGDVYNSIHELQNWIAFYAAKSGLSYRETTDIIRKAKLFCNNYHEPIRCHLLAYKLCNYKHKIKGQSWETRQDIDFGDNNIYRDDNNNPKKIIFGARPAHSILSRLYSRYGTWLPRQLENLINLSAVVPNGYAKIYVHIEDLKCKLVESEHMSLHFSAPQQEQIRQSIKDCIKALDKQKEELQNLQRLHGSDDMDMERAKDYEEKIKNPQNICE